ncbi:MAG TPA: acyl-CoA dehydrogenase family protein [Streptosporangiaceae bacterium]
MSTEFPWWTPGQRALAQESRRLADALAPRNLEVYASGEVPADALAEIARHGYFGAVIPQQYGGMAEPGTVATNLAIIMEALGRVPAASLAYGVGCGHHIAAFGSAAQRQRWLPGLASGTIYGGVAITEPFAGSDAAGLRTTAVAGPGGPGGSWVLHGRKRFITNVGLASVLLVYARTSDDPADVRRRRHLSAFLVETGAPGFSVERLSELGGSQYLRNGTLHFDEMHLPPESLLGEPGDGWQIMISGLNLERVGVAAKCLGMLDAAVITALRYIRRRRQFGHRISDIASVRIKLGEVVSEMEAARALAYLSAHLLDSGVPDLAIDSAASKLRAAETALAGAGVALEVMGADGYTSDYPVAQILADIKMYQIGAGSSDVLRDLIFRMAQRRYGAALDDPPLAAQVAWPVSADELTGPEVLRALAVFYRQHPGLHMTGPDLLRALGEERFSAERVGELRDLAAKELVDVMWQGDEPALVRATYAGLDDVAGPGFYRRPAPHDPGLGRGGPGVDL